MTTAFMSKRYWLFTSMLIYAGVFSAVYFWVRMVDATNLGITLLFAFLGAVAFLSARMLASLLHG